MFDDKIFAGEVNHDGEKEFEYGERGKQMNSIRVSYSQFSPVSLLEELRHHYDLPTDSTCIFFKSGLNDIYKITAQGNSFFLRVSLFNAYNTIQIKEEIDFILHLLSHGLSVVEPIQSKEQSYVLELTAPEGLRQAVLFRGIEQAPTGDGNVRMMNLGKLLAQVHTSSLSLKNDSIRPLINDKMLVEEPTRLLTPFLKHRLDDLEFLGKTAMALWSSVDSMLSRHSGTIGFCHGDVQPNNYFFNGEHPVIFDFDCMGRGYFAYDLGVLLANLTFMDNEIYQKDLWFSVIKGYGEVRSLNDDEGKAIYIFAALHMLRVLSYHAKCREQNQGAFYYMTDYHLDMFFGAYKRLAMLANDQAGLNII